MSFYRQFADGLRRQYCTPSHFEWNFTQASFCRLALAVWLVWPRPQAASLAEAFDRCGRRAAVSEASAAAG